MYCKNCGKEMDEKQAICLGCGVKSGQGNQYCSHCGNAVDPNATVCTKCGYAIKRSVNVSSINTSQISQTLTSGKLGVVALIVEIVGFLIAISVQSVGIVGDLICVIGIVMGIFNFKETFKESGRTGFSGYVSLAWDGMRGKCPGIKKVDCAAILIGAVLLALSIIIDIGYASQPKQEQRTVWYYWY